MSVLEQYVKEFNAGDEEIYGEYIKNSDACRFLENEIPLLECPDKEIEKAYYFRFWTYRKHIAKTEKYGHVVTEFLPHVSWADPETNVINAPVGHQFSEGKWLRNANDYLLSYADFLLTHTEISHQYSMWFLHPLMELHKMHPFSVTEKLFSKMEAYYAEWEKSHQTENGMFWSMDNYDAMEYTESGTVNGKPRKGIRPTLNSYMAADAAALGYFAREAGLFSVAETYDEKHRSLSEKINQNLWKDGIYRAFHYESEEDLPTLFTSEKCPPRELLGFIPWMFCIPPCERDTAFLNIMDKNDFFTDIGLVTLSQKEEGFLREIDHECLWNGYVWPFATSQTLKGLLNVARRHPENEQYMDIFYKLLHQYAASHKMQRADGEVYPWIDEVLHPYTGDWHSRTYLKNRGWLRYGENHYERGKDYNHSTFCDLVLSALTGLDLAAETPTFHPHIPKEWDCFKLEGISLRGKSYSILYDKTGEKYGKGAGLIVTETKTEC